MLKIPKVNKNLFRRRTRPLNILKVKWIYAGAGWSHLSITVNEAEKETRPEINSICIGYAEWDIGTYYVYYIRFYWLWVRFLLVRTVCLLFLAVISKQNVGVKFQHAMSQNMYGKCYFFFVLLWRPYFAFLLLWNICNVCIFICFHSSSVYSFLLRQFHYFYRKTHIA